MTVGKTAALAYEGNPINPQGKKALLLRLTQKMEEWSKEDSINKNKFLVRTDVPKFLADFGMAKDATEVVKAVGDNDLIMFHYLLRVGEYTVKGNRNDKKQTVQSKLED